MFENLVSTSIVFGLANVIFVPLFAWYLYLHLKLKSYQEIPPIYVFIRRLVFFTAFIALCLFAGVIYNFPQHDNLAIVTVSVVFLYLSPFWFFGLIFLFVKKKSEKVKEEASTI